MTFSLSQQRLGACGIAAALSLLAISASVHATQTVNPTLTAGGASIQGSTQAVPAGSSFTFFGMYTDDSAGPESGLGLKVKYNPAHLTNVVIFEEYTKCRLASAQKQTLSGSAEQVVFGWIDTAIRSTPAVGWPDLADALSGTQTALCLNPGTINSDFGAGSASGQKLFKITGTMAAGCTSAAACSSTVTFDSEGNFSYANGASSGFTPKSFTIQGAAVAPISFASASSRKTHNATQIDLPISTGLGVAAASAAVVAGDTTIIVEPRTGPAYSLVMGFTGSNPTVATATVVACNMWNGSMAVACTTNPTLGAVTFSGLEATIPITGVTNQSRVQIRLDLTSPSVISQDVTVGFLIGDANNNRVVQGSDVLFIQQRLLQTPASPNFTSSGFKADLNANGTVQGSDVLATQQRLLTRLP